MILICYDGSDDARAAIVKVGRLMPGADATVLTVWEQLVDVMIRSGGLAQMGFVPDSSEIDAANEQHANDQAAEGAQLACAAGLDAKPCVERRVLSVAATILAQADVVDAQVIVLGTRGLSGIKSLLLGSVSHAVVQHAHRSVMVVPAPASATARRAALPAAEGRRAARHVAGAPHPEILAGPGQRRR